MVKMCLDRDQWHNLLPFEIHRLNDILKIVVRNNLGAVMRQIRSGWRSVRDQMKEENHPLKDRYEEELLKAFPG